MKKLVCSLENPASFDVSLPARSLNKVRTVLRETPEENIQVGATKNELVINGESWGMACTLSSLVYTSSYQNMIPSRTKTIAVLDREILLGALRRSSCLGLMDEAFPRMITISFEGNSLLLDAHNDVGSALEDVEARVEGPPLRISLSANHLEDGLEALDCQRVRLLANGPKEQLLLEPDLQNADFSYVLMPKVQD